jgi:hypothetical protein
MKFSALRALMAGFVSMPFAAVVAQLPANPPMTAKPQMPAVPARTGQLPASLPKGPALSPEELEKQQKRLKNRKLTDEFFAGPVVRLEIELDPMEWEDLKKENREYAIATMVEVAPDGKKTTYKDVSVKLKGSAGSFQGPEAKPGLTLNMTKAKGGERFHGMKKFHLNNGAQDNSLLNEYLSGELCRTVSVPASRCTHAFVKWQGREMGIYVFKETFNEDMFSYFFEQTNGSLYDGHFICEIDGAMEKQEGDPNDTKDIKGLADACKEPDPKVRWQKLNERLDVAEFIRFLAMEALSSHWDGYNFNTNNYRVYFDSKSGKGTFFAHGMDQTWGQANFSLLRDPKSLVGNAVLSNPTWRTYYRKVQEEIYNRFMKSNEWDVRLVKQGRKVQDAIARWASPKAGKEYMAQVAAIKERMKARIDGLKDQFPRQFDPNATTISVGTKGWYAEGNGTMEEIALDGQKTFHVQSQDGTPGSWRCGGLLAAGKYRLQAKVKVSGVEAGGDAAGEGAGLRVSGATRKGKNGVTGSAGWQQISFDFEAPGGEVVLIAELNGKGDAWFARNSLSLSRVR